MAKIQRAAFRIVDNPRSVHRRWLGIERLESRSMLHGDDFDFDFDFGFEAESDFVFDDSSAIDDGYAELFDGLDVNDWKDTRFENQFGGGWSDDSWNLDADAEGEQFVGHDFWETSYGLAEPVVQANLIVARSPLLLPRAERLDIASLTHRPVLSETPSWTVEIAFSSNRMVEPRASLIHVVLNPAAVNVAALDSLHGRLNDVANAVTQSTSDKSSVNPKAAESEEVNASEAAATIESSRPGRSAYNPQMATARPLGLDGMLSLNKDSAPDTSKPSKAQDKPTEFGLKGEPDEADEHDLRLEAGLSPNAERVAKQSSLASRDKLPLAETSTRQDRQQGNELVQVDAYRGIGPWPEGMLSLDMAPSIARAEGPLVASMDPLALVQLFIQADEANASVLNSSIQSGGKQSDPLKASVLQKWLRDPRVSTFASIALGIVVIVSARRTSSRESKQTRLLARKTEISDTSR